MMDLSIDQLIIGIAVLILLVLALIFGLKAWLKYRSKRDLQGKYHVDKLKSPLEARSKYPDVDIFRYTGAIYKFGMVIAFLLVIFAFNYTRYEEQVIIPEDAMAIDEEIEIEPPRTKEPPPPPPPPPPPVIEEVPEEEIIEEEQPEFQDMSVEEETVIEEPAPEPVEEAPPPPPPPPEPKVEEIFTIVEDNPRFPGCEHLSSKAEREQCAQQKMLQFIYKNIDYPPVARENGVEGQVVLTFVVEKDGSITDIKVLREPGAGLGQEARRVVELMNNMDKSWIPGKQRGRPVRVQFTLPVRFQLE